MKKTIYSVIALLFALNVLGGEVDRFVHYNTDDGLSQGHITSIHCDHKGFLWIGTWNGLNRFDGYNFKIYPWNNKKSSYLSNNRIVKIWEDQKHFIWFETYDGYYHCLNTKSEKLATYPEYYAANVKKSSKFNAFYQYSEDEIWLGASNNGLYYLKFDSITGNYNSKRFTSLDESSISNNNITFITSDKDQNLWFGSEQGINLLSKKNIDNKEFKFQQYYINEQFNNATYFNNKVWFGSSELGLIAFDLERANFSIYDSSNSKLRSNNIRVLKATKKNKLIVGADELFILDAELTNWDTHNVIGDKVQNILEDQNGYLWLSTEHFSVYRIDQITGETKFFNLIPPSFKFLSDFQNSYIFEDKSGDIWVCVHGGGLAKYNSVNEKFDFFRNDISDPNSISSNTVTSMTQDHNNTLWVGTGLHGGLNKVVLRNSAVQSRVTNEVYDDFVENIVRGVLEDVNGNLWVSSKGGDVQIFNRKLEKESRLKIRYPFEKDNQTVFNVYSIFQDSKGHIWLGAKGAGLAVSKAPVKKGLKNYSNIEFYNYQNNPSDNQSISNDNIYDIIEDKWGNIWVATYGKGILKTKVDDYSNLKFETISTDNSNLTSDLVRNLLIDKENNLWITTAFGLNLNQCTEDGLSSSQFTTFLQDPNNSSSLSYNDVVHAFEDQSGQMWFGTFGGGVSRLHQSREGDYYFELIDRSDGLINNEVFSILEDDLGYLWFGTESGLSRYDKRNNSFENFNRSNGFCNRNYSENTCVKLSNGQLLFGGDNGIDKIDPGKIVNRNLQMDVIFTNFQLFNKNVEVSSEQSPLENSIAYTDNIVLDYTQSSFSLEFSAMNYLDPSKTQYKYFLEGFEKDWNYVGSQNKATYTNLKPGKYTFKVKADLWNGEWGGDISEVNIEILPPWWRTTTAYIVYMILVLLSSFLASRIILRTYAMRNELKIEKAVNEVKLQFFTNISHEIRTPLTLILGPIEDILSDKSLPDKYSDPLRLMQKNGRRMLHLLNQLLDFRKIQNKKMELKVQELNMVGFVRSVYENFEPLAKHKNIDYQFSSEMKKGVVYADPNRMDSVVFNILSNAFKFTPKGREIFVDVSESETELFVSVKDGGPGIKQKDIALIFDRYSILQDKAISNTTGTGIGLNFSNEIVKMHGGEIIVNGNYGKGCEFILVLKKGKSHLDGLSGIEITNEVDDQIISHIQPLIPDAGELEVNLGKEKRNTNLPNLLVVEDNQQIVKYIKDGFGDQYNVLVANNGEEGLAVANEKSPQIIISDIMMPVMDGVEMTKQIKDSFDTCHIPIILLTAKSGVDNQIEGHQSGAEAYVLKPFNMKVLRSMVDNILVQRKLILKKYREKGDVELNEVKINSRDQDFIDNLVTYIEQNYSNQDLSINSLAEYSCVSRTVFYNKVKGLTGASPVEFLRQIKLKIAAKMLEQGYNVSETSMNIGFNDTRYFSRQFKDLFGESPSQYKKRFNA